MEEITPGINEISYDDIGKYETVKLSDLPACTQIIYTKNTNETKNNIVVRVLINYDDKTWFAEIELKLSDNQNNYLETVLYEQKKYIGDIINFTKKDFYIVTILLCNNLTIKQVVRKCENTINDILDDLEAIMYKRLNDKFINQISEKLPVYKRALNKVKMEVKNFREESEDNHSKINHILGRVKEISSIEEKVYRKNISLYEIFNKLNDIAGLRIVCEYLSDVYELSDFLTKHPIFKLSSLEDKIVNPTSEGYRGIHLIVMTNVYYKGQIFEDIKVEIQILTSYQNTWATKTHALTYKMEKSIPQPLLKQMKILGDLLYKADKSSQILKEEVKKVLPRSK